MIYMSLREQDDSNLTLFYYQITAKIHFYAQPIVAEQLRT